jgi:spermidine synthase
MTYHVLPIGVTILVTYLFSLYLSASGFTARHSHRRFWNWMLLLAFIAAALFGLFLALRITYRWEVDFAETLMHWHVEAGITMAFTAFIHLSWHIGYYLRRARSRGNGVFPDEFHPSTIIPNHGLKPLLMLIGFVSSSSQFIMMRETAILGGGTEATTGLFLWLWLIIAAGGALIGSRSAITSVKRMVWTLLAGTALAPVCFLMMNSIVLSPGQTPSFFQIMMILAVSVAPVTFIAALIFVRLSIIRNESGLSLSGNSFGIETAGSVAAGVVTAMTVTLRIPNYQLYLFILLAASLFAAWFMEYPLRIRLAALAASIPLALLLVLSRPDPLIRGLLLRGVTVEKSSDTPFGNITTGVYGEDRTVFYDHRPLYYSGDVISAEENIHYGLLQRDGYERVLMISGGLRRHLPVLLRHKISDLTYIEMDPGLINAEGAHDTVCGSMTVRVIKQDPVSFLKKEVGTYDAIIQLIPPPSTLSVNRFYTIEYFRLIRNQLSKEGIFLCTPMPWFNYSPESYRKGFSPIYNALTGVFSHVAIIPGSLLYAVASGEPVSSAVAHLAGESEITSSYVNSDYLNDSEIKARTEQILAHINTQAGMNRALRPVTSLFANVLSLERIGMRAGIVVLLSVLIIIPFLFLSRTGFVMFASSAGLSGFGMIIIFMLQMTSGNIYILATVVLTLLMAGLATGAVIGSLPALRSLKVCVLLLTVIFTITGILAPSLAESSTGSVQLFVFIVIGAAGVITGAVYRILTSRGKGPVTGRVYAADLAGSALGYLTVGTLLVPLAGTSNSCFILGGFILISGAVASVTRKM